MITLMTFVISITSLCLGLIGGYIYAQKLNSSTLKLPLNSKIIVKHNFYIYEEVAKEENRVNKQKLNFECSYQTDVFKSSSIIIPDTIFTQAMSQAEQLDLGLSISSFLSQLFKDEIYKFSLDHIANISSDSSIKTNNNGYSEWSYNATKYNIASNNTISRISILWPKGWNFTQKTKEQIFQSIDKPLNLSIYIHSKSKFILITTSIYRSNES
jgi:hypothetical protein